VPSRQLQRTVQHDYAWVRAAGVSLVSGDTKTNDGRWLAALQWPVHVLSQNEILGADIDDNDFRVRSRFVNHFRKLRRIHLDGSLAGIS